MALGPAIMKILNKQYEPLSYVQRKHHRYDLGFKTDEKGRPILLFMGSKDEQGKIRGRRYARRLVYNDKGDLIKDHWDDKGPAT